MFHLLGFISIIIIANTAFRILGVEAKYYFDEVALLLVLGGTLTAGIITFSFKELKYLFSSFYLLLKDNKEEFQNNARDIINISKNCELSKSALINASQNNDLDIFLREGIEILTSGLNREDVVEILSERIFRDRLRDEKRINVFRDLAKYPPAFGLVGTVLGLVSLMRTVGEGAGTSEIGVKMALALVATLYGLTFANFILVPLAEHLQHKAERKKELKELQLEGILMIFDGKSSLAVQEMMNSYLIETERLDLIGLKSAA